jgi:Protein of unknown function (DUF2934)
MREQVARRAYELYVDRGCSDGYDMEDWLAAEQELALAMYAAGDAPLLDEKDNATDTALNSQLALEDQPESKITTEVEKGS